MTSTPLDHPLPWTDEEYLALGETSNRVDLIDGALWAGPRGHNGHQHIASRLVREVQAAARDAGLHSLHYVGVRLAPGSIVGPDLVVFKADHPATASLAAVMEATDVVLLGEITAPGTVAVDTVLRMHLYAQAGIEWYLVVEPDPADVSSITLRLYRLEGERYVIHDAAANEQTLVSADPFAIAIRPADLLAD